MVTDVTNRSITVIEKGFPMRLQCAIVGNPMPEVIWYRNKKPVDRGSDRTFEVVSRPGVPGCKLSSIVFCANARRRKGRVCLMKKCPSFLDVI